MKKIFAVDDSEMILKLVKNIFSSYEVDLRLFRSSKECLANLSSDIDLFILDHIFKKNDVDGLATLNRIREQYPQSQVIIISGQEDAHVVNQYFHQKIKAYILKDADFYANLEVEIAMFMRS